MRFENYVVDTNVPEHHVRFNAVVDLPFGRNKRFMGRASRWEDELVGGWQVAAIGQVISQAFFVGNSNWGAVNPIQSYKHGMNITDCQTGTCQRAKLWFNGFILPSAGAMGKITGLPSGYQVGSPVSPAYSSPINFAYTTTPGTIQATNNNVNIVTPNGTIPNVSYAPGPSTTNPYSRTELRGPYNYNADISLYKVFPIREGMFLRINFDAFNAFNIQWIQQSQHNLRHHRLGCEWANKFLLDTPPGSDFGAIHLLTRFTSSGVGAAAFSPSPAAVLSVR